MGGITYLTGSANVVDGEIVRWPEVLRDGTNLSVAMWLVPCERMISPWLCEPVTNRQTGTIVLGVLPSGNYHLWVYEFNRGQSTRWCGNRFPFPNPAAAR